MLVQGKAMSEVGFMRTQQMMEVHSSEALCKKSLACVAGLVVFVVAVRSSSVYVLPRLHCVGQPSGGV
jgi:hypothetical protein